MVVRLLSAFVLITHLPSGVAIGQPLANFTLPSKACRNELFTPVNTSSIGSYKWEFCYAGLHQVPVFQSPIIIAEAFGPDGIAVEKENGNWYGFVVSTNSNSLIRLDFGSDPSQNPTVVNLGNPGGLLLRPRDVALIRHQGNWFALVANFDAATSTARMVRLDFGSSLLTAPSATDLGSFSGRLTQPFSVTWKTDNGKLLALVGDRSQRKILLVNFQSNPTFTPTAASFFIEAFLPASGFFRDFDLVKAGSTWYGLAVSENGAIQKLKFNNTLFSIPDVAVITNDLPAVNSPSNVVFLRDIDTYVALVTEYTGNVVKLDFGSNPASFLPAYQNLGNGELWANNQGLAVLKAGNRWIGYALNTATSRLNRVIFQGDCSASLADSEQTNPAVSFSSAGSKKISLQVTDSFGETDYRINSLLIKGDPIPDFLVSYNCTGQLTFFTDASASEGTLMAWSWNFNDPLSGNPSSNLQNPSHQFSSASVFSVDLEVTDDCGVSVSISKPVNVQDASLVDLLIDAPGTVCSFQDILFNPQSTFGISSIRETEWSFGDGNGSTLVNPTHQYNANGTMLVELEAVVAACRKTTQLLIQVNEGNSNSFSVSGICETEGTTFTPQSVGLPVTALLWTFGDGSTSTELNPVHPYLAGNYSVTLQTTNSAGCVNSIAQPLTIYSKPQTDFSVALPPFSCSGTPTQFTDTTPNLPDSNIAMWLWSFGDGAATSTLKNPQYTYASAGTYQVTLTVTTNFGCSATMQKPALISSSPAVDFSYSPPCRNVPVNFADQTSGTGQSWLWQIESSFYSIQNPVHTFATSGIKTAMVAVTGANGCVGTRSKQIVVPEQLVPDFIVEKNCVNQQTKFSDNTNDFTDPITAWQWTFGALGSRSGNPAIFTFPSTGNVNVNLTVTTQTGCTYSRVKSVNIGASPQASFTALPAVGQAPLPVAFNNTSTGATSYFWSFGDNNNSTSTAVSPTFTYPQLGQYTAELTAFNLLNCQHKATQIIHVVVPHLDVTMNFLELLNNQGAVVPVVTLMNKSNVPVENPVVVFDLSGRSAIQEAVNITMPPNSSYRHMAGLSVPLRPGLNYICAEVLIDDTTPADNRMCASVESSFLVVEPYPNPVINKEEISVEWISTAEGKTEISLLNNTGQQVFTSTSFSASGYNLLKLPAANLKPGLYIIRISNGKAVRNFRIIIGE